MLERRVGRWSGGRRFYLFCEVDSVTGQIEVETSWLPDLPEVRRELEPLGFQRRPDGSYHVRLPDVEDHLGILRRATKALAWLLKEAT